MGTRGIYGIRKNKKDKTTYNHYDSYPSYLGEQIIEFIKNHTEKEIEELYDRLILVNENLRTSQFTNKQKEKYKECLKKEDFFSHVGNRKETGEDISMYQFLHDFQGKLEKYFEFPEIDLMIDNSEFIKESLFCEWGYIINLDTKEFEIWIGFQNIPCKKNRYGEEKIDDYYPCKLIKKIPLNIINSEFELRNEFKDYE